MFAVRWLKPLGTPPNIVNLNASLEEQELELTVLCALVIAGADERNMLNKIISVKSAVVLAFIVCPTCARLLNSFPDNHVSS